MRKLLIIALTMASTYVFGQGKTLYSAEMITPKMGKAAAFETKWKTHLSKFHGKDDARRMYEILSGDNTGSYLLVEGPKSFADMDNAKPNAEAHGLDYDNAVSPATEKITGINTYRWVDTLSYNGAVVADKFVTTVYQLKYGKGGDLMAELRRAFKVNTIIKSPGSVNVYTKQWAGSKPEVVVISNLKDGFKQLEANYTPSMGTAFKDTYIKEFGQDAWDKRLKLLPEIVENMDVYISKLRKDLSTASN